MKSLPKFLAGLAAALLVLVCAPASAQVYYGYNPNTGLEVTHGADVSGGVLPKITVTGTSCTVGTIKGGASTGSFVETGGTSCTFTITFPAAAPTGWSCYVNDLTTPADGPAKAASTTTTTWVSGATTVVSADVLQFSCVGY